MTRRILNTLFLAACVITALCAINGTKIFVNATPTGGDMAGHVWWPAYMRDHLLPSGRLSGWTMDFYGGFPAGQFYFPLPALIIIALNIIFPYGVAFKLGAALGTLLIPVAAYAFAKNMRWRDPAPHLAAVGATWFLLFSGEGVNAFNQRISGGTLASMLVGEFSYGWGITFMLLGLGLLRRSLREGRGGWLAALCFWAVIWSHAIVGIMTAVLAIVIVVLETAWSKKPGALGKGAVIGIAGGLAASAWFLPFVLRWETWTTAVRYEKLTNPIDFMFSTWFRFPAIAAVFGLGAWCAIAIEGRIVRRGNVELAIPEACGLAGLSAVAFILWPEGVAWNLRYLPFWYLFVSIAGGVVIAEGIRGLSGVFESFTDSGFRAAEAELEWTNSDGSTDSNELVAYAGDGGPSAEEVVPYAEVLHSRPNYWPQGIWMTILTGVVSTALLFTTFNVWGAPTGIISGWSSGNWNGFEAYPGYSEYRHVIQTMEGLPAGWAKWEEATDNGSDNLAHYGSDFALVILPFWTDGKIASYESLYFEGNASTAYNFLTTGHVSRNPSNLIRGLPYATALTDFDEGVNMMRRLGIRYYMAYSPEAVALASASSGLKLVTTVDDYDGTQPLGWKIYEIRNAAIVAPLEREPVVTSIHERDAWMLLAAQWFEDPTLAAQPIVQDGPASWRRVSASSGKEPNLSSLNLADVPEYREKKIDAARTLNAASALTPRTLPKVSVKNVRITQDSVSFDVDRTGVPVQVRVSAYPNWEVSGGKGPYRSTPNQMVVIPTSKHVELHFKRTSDEVLGIVMSVVGIVVIFGLWVWERRRRNSLLLAGMASVSGPAATPELDPEPPLVLDRAAPSTLAPEPPLALDSGSPTEGEEPDPMRAE